MAALRRQGWRNLTESPSKEFQGSASREKLATGAAVAGLVLLAVALAAKFSVNAFPLIPDEPLLILGPGAMKGAPYPAGVYPGFPRLFYSFFVWLSKPLLPEAPFVPFVVGRAVNLALYGGAIALFFLTARQYLSRRWSFLAAFLFAFTPVVFFSGVFVKTESLLIVEILLSFYAAGRIVGEPGKLRWHALAGLALGLSVATKFNPFPLLSYAGALMAVDEPRRFLKERRPLLVFALAASAALALSWPGVFHLSDYDPRRFRSDDYFLAAPSAFRSVTEGFAFPYGRVSYAFLFILPLAAGLANYAAAALGLLCRALPRRALIVTGLFSAGYLVFALSFTAWRPAWLFTPLAPFLALAAVFFWKRLWEGWLGRPGRVLAIVGIPLAIFLSSYQYTAVAAAVDGTVKGEIAALRRVRAAGKGVGDVLVLTNAALALQQGISPVDPAGGVLKKRPAYILILDSYAENFCKYRKSPGYSAQCEFFRRLLSGRAGYREEWSRPVDFPMKTWTCDPEASFTLHLMQRKDLPPACEA